MGKLPEEALPSKHATSSRGKRQRMLRWWLHDRPSRFREFQRRLIAAGRLPGGRGGLLVRRPPFVDDPGILHPTVAALGAALTACAQRR